MNFVDISVLAVLGLSTLLAFGRGFVKELLSILSWVGATIATIFLFPLAVPYAREQIADELLAEIAAAIVLFVVTLFALGFVNHFISSRVQKSALGATDRLLGLVFGLARGIVVVALAHIVMTLVFPNESDRPEIIQQARSLPYAASAAAFIVSKLPPDLLEKGGVILDEGLDAAEKSGAALDAAKTLTGQPESPQPGQAQPNQDGQGGESGYNDAERKDLERLLQGSQGDGQ